MGQSALRGSLILLLLLLSGLGQHHAPIQAQPNRTYLPMVTRPAILEQPITLLLDDFAEVTGQASPFNRLGGKRGLLNESTLQFINGLAITTIAPGATWGGAWLNLALPAHEGRSLDLTALLPAPIKPAYQSRVVGLRVEIATGPPGRLLRIELKDGSRLRWAETVQLHGGRQQLQFDLPTLGAVSDLLWVLEAAAPGEQVAIEHISMIATTAITDVPTAAFVWSYGMLLDNWHPTTGLVRDKAHLDRGELENIPATGSLAAATALAAQLGVIEQHAADQIVQRIAQALLVELPRWQGLWPHFGQTNALGKVEIVPGSEWSSVDTVIAALGLLTAQAALDHDTTASETLLATLDWAALTTSDGAISHGYTEQGKRLAATWDTFGGESWLVALAYAGAIGQVPSLDYPHPPTANGSGFIDELAWLYLPMPTSSDYWGTAWQVYRNHAAEQQLGYLKTTYPQACLSQLGLFGLSAGEVPSPWQVTGEQGYQTFGVGGQHNPANDGVALLGHPVITPHYAAMIAPVRPNEATTLWAWLITQGLFSPLTNVESVLLPTTTDCGTSLVEWNHLKGSWNLALQSLGWGHALIARSGQDPTLWHAVNTSPLLQRGYALLSTSPIQSDGSPPPWRLASMP